jgi:hypothetical protein
LEDTWQNVFQVWSERLAHKQANSLPCGKQVNTLSVSFLELGVLDCKQNLDDVVGNLRESFFTYSRTDNCDCFNDLSSELLILRLIELAEIAN